MVNSEQAAPDFLLRAKTEPSALRHHQLNINIFLFSLFLAFLYFYDLCKNYAS